MLFSINKGYIVLDSGWCHMIQVTTYASSSQLWTRTAKLYRCTANIYTTDRFLVQL